MPRPSSVIRAFRYDPKGRELTIAFTSGRTYVYFGVPEEVREGLGRAESRGEYFNAEIRGRYDYRELGGG